MKKIFASTILALLMISVGYGQGINFTTASLDETMAKAKAENKAVFVDVTAKWCSPCKWMEKNVFTDSTVAKYFNATFLNCKLDADDKSHKEFLDDYRVSALPAYLVFSPDGQLAYVMGGSMDAQSFLTQAKFAFQETQLKKPIAVWNSEYAAHKNDTAFLRKYIKRRSHSNQSNGSLIEDYLTLLSEEQRYSSQTIHLLQQNAGTLIAPGLAYEVALNCRTKLKDEEKTGDLVDILLMQYVLGLLEDAVNKKDETRLELMYPLARAVKNPDLMVIGYKLQLKKDYLRGIGNIPEYLKVAEQYLDQYILNPGDFTLLSDSVPAMMSLNSTAWSFYENTEEKSELRKALNWSQKSIELVNSLPMYKPQFFSALMDTKANLLYKLGEKDAAIETLQQAINAFPDDEYSLTQKVEYTKRLEKMKKGDKI